MIKTGTYILDAKMGDFVPCSDAAGEIEEVGTGVTLFKKVSNSMIRLTTGRPSMSYIQSGTYVWRHDP
jgi:NADPH:quinone reductase-like Zn-dependent oxidoreductase